VQGRTVGEPGQLTTRSWPRRPCRTRAVAQAGVGAEPAHVQHDQAGFSATNLVQSRPHRSSVSRRSWSPPRRPNAPVTGQAPGPDDRRSHVLSVLRPATFHHRCVPSLTAPMRVGVAGAVLKMTTSRRGPQAGSRPSGPTSCAISSTFNPCSAARSSHHRLLLRSSTRLVPTPRRVSPLRHPTAGRRS